MSQKASSKYVRRDGERGKELFTFEEVSRIDAVDSHTYRANVHPEFSYGTSAHGGFLLALIWKTITHHFSTTLSHLNQPNTFSLHNEFLRPCSTGVIELKIRDVRIGKTTSTIHITLSQGKSECCACYATNSGPLAIRNTISQDTGYRGQQSLPPIDFDAVLSQKDANWIRYDVGRDPQTPNHTLCNVIFVMPRHPPSPSLDPQNRRFTTQWITPRVPEEKWTTPMLGLLMDHSVPPLENFFPDAPHNAFSMPVRALRNEKDGLTSYDHPPWSSPRYYPTVSMTIEVKRQLPAEGVKWLCLRWAIKECVDGRFDIEAEIWDPEGNLVALGQSLWFVVDLRALQGTGKRVAEAEKKGIRREYGDESGKSKILSGKL
ncbi:hypothetical protein CKM354_000888700 [Cercospora kikuchii]|uniref:Thioesterase-like superfamily-domain-containing protein n=1 Tax=Cercospora kikuchii TaxID=84275 RepID=A0A9P3CWN9_9PEZI|nr:uncharacterized protein CKM354_000888700 [Cercospora kikuchii]GIZ45733.1 hypothetical protein CKM354_000888700 [Cercospora kikuchii]